MDTDASTEPFTLREVLGDALDSLRSDWQAHLGWNLIWVCVALVTCCGTTFVFAIAGAALGASRHGQDTSARVEEMTGVLVLVYLFLIPLMLLLYALHQSVTMTLTHAFCRRAPITLRAAIEQGLRRTPALAVHLLMRTFAEGLPIAFVYFVCFAIVWAVFGVRGADLMHAGPGVAVVLAIGYVLVLTLAFGLRGLFGLAFACVVDGVGPIAAFGRSIELLRGRRWQFIRLRLAVLAAWMFTYLACFGPFFATTFAANQGHPNPALALVTLPFLFGFYGALLFVIVVDAALEAAFHARVTRPLDALALAATFD